MLGGVLTDANLFGWSWRSVFFVNVPVAVVAMIAGLRVIPETRDPAARRPNYAGAVLLAASMAAIVYPLLEGRELGWPAWVWPLLAAGRCKPVIDSTYPLADAASAHARMESSAHIGKIVLTV